MTFSGVEKPLALAKHQQKSFMTNWLTDYLKSFWNDSCAPIQLIYALNGGLSNK